MLVPNCFSKCCEKALLPEPFSEAASLPRATSAPLPMLQEFWKENRCSVHGSATSLKGQRSLEQVDMAMGEHSIDVLARLAAVHLVAVAAVCQTLDLRTLHAYFVAGLGHDFYVPLAQDLHIHLVDPGALGSLQSSCWAAFMNRIDTTVTLDSSVRNYGSSFTSSL